MTPLPKRRHSTGRRDRRRAHDALTAPHLIVCSHCGEAQLPHRVCGKCGHYNKREIIAKSK
ncbi:50S ribosomal protein L32 [Anaerolineae bacterium]|jgi:large subunit ribosomal protein L32|nr:50S ribosomal protein L32 [Chloroflexota bacterium]GBL38626.1 50S ribosomal protein L32 [Anaerolineaceae bacterium]GDX68236.1 50S ribosomal protein L32 [Anaerolineae bacterium]RLT42179.1 MAG: 50S ribosomal protein L32 [Chloroflexota bacterium]RLT46434.1 MAG: 50S ribosomal protein L32 [Chloroflexota bacterium]